MDRFVLYFSFIIYLSDIMDIDFESVPKRIAVSVIDDPHCSTLKFQRLDSELTSLAREMLRSLGVVLGAKYGAIFVDVVVSDMFEASLQIPTSHDSHVEWMHEWIGSLTVVKEVLLGAFLSKKCSNATEDSNKGERRSYRILQSLASSILSLMVNSSLWNLPISNRHPAKDRHKGPTPKVLESNACIAILLLELIRTLCYLLKREDVESMVPALLYPVVEKVSQNYAEAIEAAATQTLSTVGVSLGAKTISDLIFQEQPRLAGSMLSRLRLPGGSHIPSHQDAAEILTVTNSARWTLEMSARASLKIEDCFSEAENAKSCMVDLMSLLEYRLDHLILKKILESDDIEKACSLHKAFFDFILFSLGVKRGVIYCYRMKGVKRAPGQSWMEQLSKFRISTNLIAIHEPSSVHNGENESTRKSLNVNQTEIDLFSRLIARSCYLLSRSSLKNRISACECLTSGFTILAFVGSEHEVCAILIGRGYDFCEILTIRLNHVSHP
jgi:hypothetical protein